MRDRPFTEIEYDGKVDAGEVETEAVVWVSRLRSPSFMLALYWFTKLIRNKGFYRRLVDSTRYRRAGYVVTSPS